MCTNFLCTLHLYIYYLISPQPRPINTIPLLSFPHPKTYILTSSDLSFSFSSSSQSHFKNPPNNYISNGCPTYELGVACSITAANCIRPLSLMLTISSPKLQGDGSVGTVELISFGECFILKYIFTLFKCLAYYLTFFLYCMKAAK